MTETAAPAPATPKVKKVVKAKKASTHPGYNEMVKQAVTKLGDKSGSSRQAIVKYILKNFKTSSTEKTVTLQTKLALKRCVSTGFLKQTKGTGASGSFKIDSKKKEEKKSKKSKKATKPKVKPKSSTKKTVKKPASNKSKKVKKPQAAKLTKKSPKKVVSKKIKPKKFNKPKKPKATKKATKK